MIHLSIPSFRFPGYTEDWHALHFEDALVSVSSGKSDTRTDGTSYPIYGSTGIIGSSKSYDYEGDSLLVARVGANAGTMHRVSGKYKVSDNTLILSPKNSVSLDFIQYLLQHIDLTKLVFGSGQPLVTASQLKKVSLTMPEIGEQVKIAGFLKAVDEKLTILEQKVEKLETYKHGAMQQIFSQKIRFKHTDGSQYPGWETKQLGELLNKNRRRNKDNSISYIQTVSNKHGFVSQDEYFDGASIASKNTLNYFVIKKGTFAYNPSRINVGSLAYKIDAVESIVSPLYVSFTAKEGLVDDFILFWFFSMYFTKQMNRSFEGSVRDTLSFDSLCRMEIELPNLEEQQKIATFLSSLDAKITHTRTQLDMTKEFKKALLQRMFV